MAEVLLLGEDKAHAVLLGVLLRQVVQTGALEAQASWLLDDLTAHVVFRGDGDLSMIAPGLRYTSTLQGFHPIGPGGRPIRLTRRKEDGTPVGPEATKWRKVFLAVMREPLPDAVLVARDTDGEPDKLGGLQQEVEHQRSLHPLVPLAIAAPHQDAEGWLVAGFEARDEREKRRLAGLARALSFDPTRQPDRLTAHPNDSPRDAKRVLRQLLDLGEESRPLDPEELRDHHERLLGDLERLGRQGHETGLPEFLDALRARLMPLWLAARP